MASYYSGGKSFRERKAPEEVDPMSSMSNIGDVMLVFACGLMVALVLAWNVPLKDIQKVELGEQLDQSQVSQANEQAGGDGKTYVDKGRVVQDPATGEYYFLDDSGSSGGAGNAGGNDNG